MGLMIRGSFMTQGVALGYPISPLWGWLQNINFFLLIARQLDNTLYTCRTAWLRFILCHA